MNFFIIFFRTYKNSKYLSPKSYQENKERLQKKLVKDIKIFLNKEKKKSNNIIASITKTKISQNMMEIKSC